MWMENWNSGFALLGLWILVDRLSDTHDGKGRLFLYALVGSFILYYTYLYISGGLSFWWGPWGRNILGGPPSPFIPFPLPKFGSFTLTPEAPARHPRARGPEALPHWPPLYHPPLIYIFIEQLWATFMSRQFPINAARSSEALHYLSSTTTTADCTIDVVIANMNYFIYHTSFEFV